MPIPAMFGKSKIKMLRGEEDWGGHHHRHSDSDGLAFSLDGAAGDGLIAQPSFNVLLVETRRPRVLQAPALQWLSATWQESLELLRPLLRLGLSQTSLLTKCPHYDAQLHASPAGAVLATPRQRRVLWGVQQGAFGGHAHAASHQDQQLQPQQQRQRQQQQQQHAIPPQRHLVPELPAGHLVLALNLLAHWAITGSAARRGGMAG